MIRITTHAKNAIKRHLKDTGKRMPRITWIADQKLEGRWTLTDFDVCETGIDETRKRKDIQFTLRSSGIDFAVNGPTHRFESLHRSILDHLDGQFVFRT
jgi:hypothetical protein